MKLGDKIYNEDWRKLDVQGKDEYVNSYEGGWLEQPQLTLWEGFKETIKTSAKAGAHHTFEAKSISDHLIEKQIQELNDWTRDESVNPVIQPEELKKEYGLDSKYPMTKFEAQMKAHMKHNSDNIYAEAGHYMYSSPLNFAAGMATQAAIASFTPFNVALGVALGAGAPLVVGGGATMAAKMAKQWKSGAMLYKQVKKAHKLAKQAKAAKAAAQAAQRIGLTRAAQLTKRVMTRPGVAKFAVGSGIAGATNALEELIIWQIDKNNGIKEALAPQVTMGILAPAVLGGFINLGIKKPVKLVREKAKILDEDVVSTDSFDVFYRSPVDKLNARRANLKLDEIKNVGDLVKLYEEEVKLLKDHPDAKLSTEAELELSHLKTIQHAGKQLGERELTSFLVDAASMMAERGLRVDMKELFPFLRNTKAFDAHIKQLRETGKIPKEAKLNAGYLNDVFKVDPRTMAEYLKKMTLNENLRQPKRNFVENEVKGPEGDAYVNTKLDESKRSADPIEAELGNSAKDLNKALDSYLSCLAGDLTDGKS